MSILEMRVNQIVLDALSVAMKRFPTLKVAYILHAVIGDDAMMSDGTLVQGLLDFDDES